MGKNTNFGIFEDQDFMFTVLIVSDEILVAVVGAAGNPLSL